MFDGIKVQDVTVSVDGLLTNDRLTFGGLVDTQTGFILNPERRAQDRGLNFRLVPRRVEPGYRVEVKGSLHKFYNNGLHNADQYTVNDLLLTLNQLVTEYGFNLSESKINNIEFGVNIELPFAVRQVFDNLICYKNQPFVSDSFSQTSYYTCNRQRYTVKIYDKGKQKGLGCNLLRFEIRVRKMQYFDGTGVQLRTLADLLNVANYGQLGGLLVGTFNDILFDDPTINTKALTPKEQAIYQQCRNPRYWYTPNELTPKQAAAHRQRVSRNKDHFRALLSRYGSSWPQQVSTLIQQTWEHLTAVDNESKTRIEHYKIMWQRSKPAESMAEKCHELTDSTSPVTEGLPGEQCHKLTAFQNGEMSQINPLYSGVLCDAGKPAQPILSNQFICPITGISIDQPQPGQRFVSALMLRNNDDLMLTLAQQHQQYAKGSKEYPYSRVAHNVRNKDSNPRNNLRRKIDRFNQKKGGQQSLFPESDVLRLTDQQRALLDYWKGTPYEIRF